MDYKNTNEGISVLHRIVMKNESQQQSHHVTQNLNTYPCTMYIPSSIYINWDTQGQIQTTAQNIMKCEVQGSFLGPRNNSRQLLSTN